MTRPDALPRTLPLLAAAGLGLLAPLVGIAGGGLGIGAAAPLAGAAVGVAALMLAALPGMFPRSVAAATAASALAGLGALLLLSMSRSPLAEVGWPIAVKGALYAAVFIVAAMAIRSRRAAWALIGGLAGGAALLALIAIVQVATAADPSERYFDGRLAGPVGYQNGFSTILLCGAIAALALTIVPCATPARIALRTAAFAALGLCVGTAAATESRAATLAGLAGVVVLAAITPARIRLTLPVGAAAVVYGLGVAPAVQMRDGVLEGTAAAARAADEWWPNPVLGALAMALIGLVYGLLEHRTGHLPRVRRGARVASLAAVALVAVAGVGFASLNASQIADRASEPLRQDDGPESREGARLLSVSSNGRSVLWRAAAGAIRDAPVLGQGAGGFAIWWNIERGNNFDTTYAHSLPLEIASETGLVGLGLLLVWIGATAWAAVGLIRRQPALRAPAAALVALVAVWFTASSVDWLWNLPAATLAGIVAAGALVGLAYPRREGVPGGRRGHAAIAAGALVAGTAALVAISVPYRADRALDRAEELSASDPAGARAAIARAEGLTPDDSRIDLLRAEVSRTAGDLDRARRELVRGTERLPDYFATWERLADFDQYVLHQPRRAVPSLRRGLEVHRYDAGLRDRIVHITDDRRDAT